jgi:hypothetical protein
MPRLLPTLPLALPARPAVPRRRSARRSAKVAVLSGVGCFLLAHLGLNVALDTTRPEYRDPEYGHRRKELGRILRYEERYGGRRPVVVALGSSRTEMALGPQHLGLGDGPSDPLVYNFGLAGCGPIGEVLTLRRLLDTGVKPDAVLVEVLPPVLAGDGPAEAVVVPASKLGVRDLGRLARYSDDPAALRNGMLAARVNPWYGYRLTLISHWGLASWLPWQHRQDFLWTQLKPNGWMPYFHQQLSPEKRAEGQRQAKADYQAYFAAFRIAPRADKAFRDLLDICRGHGIRVAFLLPPESPTFRSWYPPGAIDTARAYVGGLSRESGGPVFDARDWYDDETLFADGHHLLGHAAVAFSRRLGKECLGPWLRDLPK